MWPFKKKEPEFIPVNVSAEKYLTQGDVNSKPIADFEKNIRLDVSKANFNLVGTLAPWEVLTMYVVALEKRVKELESK